jgi:hypothetical protein
VDVWLELHVDDELLSADPAVWPEVAALLESAARAAADEGGRISFRFRERFARLDTHGFIRALVSAGHECGWHAHGRRLGAARDAVVAAGGTAAVAAPGLVQTGLTGARATLDAAARLGARVVTDRLRVRPFGWRGRVAYRPVDGVIALDPSVDPVDWGVHRRMPDWSALTDLAARVRALPPLPGHPPYFGATFHEHDLCSAGSLRARAPDLDGLRRFVAAYGAAPSQACADARARGALHAPLPSRVRVVRERVRALLPGPSERSGPPVTHGLTVGARTVHVTRTGPAHPLAALVVVHGGTDGRGQGLSFLGLPDDAFPDLAVWTFTRTPGTARAPGNPVHLADTRAVLAAARAEGVPVGLLSWSGGIVNALRALDDPRDIAFLVDVEGPVDRWSLVPPCRPRHEWADASEHDDALWNGREVLEHLTALGPRHLRVQGAPDHVHGACDLHAVTACAASGGMRINVAGPVASGGRPVRDAVEAWVRARLPDHRT